MKKGLGIQLEDEKAERVRRNHDERIAELQSLPSAGMKTLADVSLADGVFTLVAHGLGRFPTFVKESVPRGAVSSGRIDEVRDGSYDRSKFLGLKATGFGATIVVDVQVM